MQWAKNQENGKIGKRKQSAAPYSGSVSGIASTQSNFDGSNTFGTMKISSRQG